MSNNESSVYRCPSCSSSSPSCVNCSEALSDPPSFGDTVRLVTGGPLMVVVDSVPLRAGAPHTSSIAVFYLDDCGVLHTERVPWGLLSHCSLDLLVAERRCSDREYDAALIAREEVRTSARLAALRDELGASSDPASFFGVLRSAIMSLLDRGYEVDHRGSPESIAAEDACPPTSPSSDFVAGYRSAVSELRRSIDPQDFPECVESSPLGASVRAAAEVPSDCGPTPAVSVPHSHY
jgi:hypothetical protein